MSRLHLSYLRYLFVSLVDCLQNALIITILSIFSPKWIVRIQIIIKDTNLFRNIQGDN